MRTERMPWTCRWSEFRPVNPEPVWMDAWMAQWACLAKRREALSTDLDRCLDCQRWESRDERQGQPSRSRDR